MTSPFYLYFSWQTDTQVILAAIQARSHTTKSDLVGIQYRILFLLFFFPLPQVTYIHMAKFSFKISK